MGGIVDKYAFLPPDPACPIQNTENVVTVPIKSGFDIPILCVRSLNANKAIIFSHGKRMQMNTNCGWKFLL
jgi:hypothetical protein